MSTVPQAIRATRGALRDAASAREWCLANPKHAQALHGKNLVYFNGAFSPPTRAHTYIAAALAAEEGVEALWLDPEPNKPGKERWQDETMDARVEMCELMATEACPSQSTGVGTLRKDLGPKLGTSPELFRTMRNLLGGPGKGKLCWALGADVFEGMQYWAEKARACLQPGDTCDSLLLFVREGWTEERLSIAVQMLRDAPCEIRVISMPDELLGLSSQLSRQTLLQAHVLETPEALMEVSRMMLPGVANYCLSSPHVMDIYRQQVEAQILEKSKRNEQRAAAAAASAANTPEGVAECKHETPALAGVLSGSETRCGTTPA